LTEIVVDASTALAWCFPDETSERADAILASLEGKTILVPAMWGLEIANAVLVGERSKRLRQPEIRRFATLLESLPIVQDTRPATAYISEVLPVAREYSLTAYDAAYLELCMRHSAPLATLDAKLQRAAERAGVEIFSGDSPRSAP
jgi:predicted nucleic acid-binding protein